MLRVCSGKLRNCIPSTVACCTLQVKACCVVARGRTWVRLAVAEQRSAGDALAAAVPARHPWPLIPALHATSPHRRNRFRPCTNTRRSYVSYVSRSASAAATQAHCKWGGTSSWTGLCRPSTRSACMCWPACMATRMHKRNQLHSKSSRHSAAVLARRGGTTADAAGGV